MHPGGHEAPAEGAGGTAAGRPDVVVGRARQNGSHPGSGLCIVVG
jgi:hypothetical protein